MRIALGIIYIVFGVIAFVALQQSDTPEWSHFFLGWACGSSIGAGIAVIAKRNVRE